KARYDSTMQAADWLSKQLADLQIKVETSQTKLIEYQKENGIVGADDKTKSHCRKAQRTQQGTDAGAGGPHTETVAVRDHQEQQCGNRGHYFAGSCARRSSTAADGTGSARRAIVHAVWRIL